MSSTLVMIGGESYRVGQIGGFFRLSLGYTNLYAVCTQIGADAAPPGSAEEIFGTGPRNRLPASSLRIPLDDGCAVR